MYATIARMLCTLGLAGLLLAAAPASADPHKGPGHGRPPAGYAWDGRHHHDRYYPVRGRVVYGPPAGYRVVKYRSVPYRYYAGSWYRPYGTRFIVAAPPVGLTVSFLPNFYTIVRFGGVPYYYANDVYYVARPAGGYVVTEPPSGRPARVEAAPASAGEDFYMYPRNGQGEERQARDRYECHRWAAGQTGFDPTLSQGGVPASQTDSRRSEYLRAISACLDGRGYTLR